MRLIVPIEQSRPGGVERVTISLLTEIAKVIDRVILVLPDKQIPYFQSLLPASDRIVYESFRWPDKHPKPLKIRFLNRIAIWARPFQNKDQAYALAQMVRGLETKARITHLIEQHQATHCLYPLINRVKAHRFKIPSGIICHDLFWRFAPLTYPDTYVREHDQRLLAWLRNADLVFAVSEKTRQDLLSVFPKFAKKLKVIPLSGFLTEDSPPIPTENPTSPVSFYFPAGFGIYKDQLALLKAGIKLAQKQLPFKIILTGKETDGLVKGQLQLTQQSGSQEYLAYIQECQSIFEENQSLIEQHFVGLGYCDPHQVEHCYQTSSCIVMPSRYEGFGMPISEAIVRGLPVICSDLSVFQEQIQLYNCADRMEFFPVGDSEALTDRLEAFILNPKPRLSPQEAWERFSHWTWQDVAQKYITLLEQAPR